MNYTTNYNLKKPSSSDFVKVSDLNENFDVIDGALKSADDKINTANQKTVASVSVSGTTITFKNEAGAVIATIETQDTNTWRGIQNTLTSASTVDSLSAAQGKALNDKIKNVTTQHRTVVVTCDTDGSSAHGNTFVLRPSVQQGFTDSLSEHFLRLEDSSLLQLDSISLSPMSV